MGVKSKKKAKTRLDAYYRLAKEQGYRARSAFKLLQLNRKYDFLARARVLVDLCAAPGGWCQVAAKYMPVGSKIVGVDLVPIQPIRGVKTFVGDITADQTRKMIRTWLKKEPVDCVIHDGAPNVGGVWSRDLYDQNALVLSATKMACSLLKQGGWFVTKVFRSPDFHKLLWVLKQLFEKVEATKPLASRMESAEIFVVCAGFFSPKQLDPEMFNPQKVFTDVGEEKIVSPSGALVLPKCRTPQGYEEFATVPHPVASFTEFLEASDPKSFLRSQHELRFATDEEKALLQSKYSKKELVYLCGDLQQVGEADRKRLLRWREQLLREKAAAAAKQQTLDAAKRSLGKDEEAPSGESDADSMDGNGGRTDEDEEEDDDADEEGELHLDLDDPESVTRIARELLELRKKKAKEMKKKQKKVVDRKLKQIKGLINYDPSSLHEETVTGVATVDRETAEEEGAGGLGVKASRSTTTVGEHLGNDGGRKGRTGTGMEPSVLDSFTVEKLALVDEAEVSAMMDQASRAERLGAGVVGEAGGGGGLKGTNSSPLLSAPLPLQPVMSVNLATQEDWNMGDDEDEDEDIAGDEDSSEDEDHPTGTKSQRKTSAGLDASTRKKKRTAAEEALLPQSATLVEGEEYYMDVDNYGNYVPAQRSARVTLFEGGLEEDQEEDGEEEEGVLSPAEKKKRAKAQKEAKQLEEAGKQSKWQRHHLNIQHVLNDTFPMPSSKKKKNSTTSTSPSSRSHAKEEEEEMALKKKTTSSKREKVVEGESSVVTLQSSEVLPLEREGGTRVGKKRTRFDGSDDDDEDDDESDDEDDDDEAFSEEVDEDELAQYDVHQGRKDSRRKREIVESLGSLTTQELVRQQRKQVLLDNKERRKQKRLAAAEQQVVQSGGKKKGGNSKKEKDETTFEEIPIGLTDPTIRARTLALAQKMLDPKARRDILDASVNKYVFDDDEDLPDWFIKDEQRNCTIPLPVTAEEMEEQRRRFKELNARPSKKVMEAMGRKYRRAQRLLHNIMEKGKSDPRAREKANKLSIRKLMRAQVIKGQPKKKHRYLDRQSMGQMRRERQKAKRERRKPGKKKR